MTARLVPSLAGALALAVASTARADAPTPAAQAVPDPGHAIASTDDAAAIAVNPGTLPFLPEPELRWNWVWTGSSSTLPITGHSFSLGLPIWIFATGLRLDLMNPPDDAMRPESWRWLRWAFGLRGGDAIGLGLTAGWASSDDVRIDGSFSLTAGLSLRPSSYLALGAVARHFNDPRSDARVPGVSRGYDLGVALRPTGTRVLELAGEAVYDAGADVWAPRGTLGIDVPRVGRLRGDVTVLPPPEPQPGQPEGETSVVAMAGLDLNAGLLQLSGGGVFGDAITRAGTGFYAGVSFRGYREPGVQFPAKVAKIKIDSTPGNRGHVRLLRRLWRLTKDPETAGVLFVMRDEPASSLAHSEELGEAIRGLRAAGKKVMCHLEDASGRSLYVCAQADRIAMNPAGGLRFAGLSTQYFYFGDLLKKVGVRADFVRIGAHKLAAEQFTRGSGTDVAREDHQDLINQFEAVYLHDVGGGRRIPADELKRRIAKGPFLAREARDAGLIDVLAYDDEIDRFVEETFGRPARVVDDEPSAKAPERWTSAPKVAVVYLAGDMVDGESKAFPFVGVRLAGSYTISRALKRAREDSSVRAVVFRIETGGGSSLAADVILREAILTARAKPLIVSMGSAAASGGYYASVAGKRIFANRGTVTGSIGIFYGKVDVQQLLDKLDVGVEQFRTSPRADAESFFRPFTDEEHRELGVKVKQFYDLFIGRVAEGRKMKPEAVDAVARGHVWTGAQAQARGLVDDIGTIRAALAEARRLGGLPPDAPIMELPEDDESLLGMILDLAGVSSQMGGAAMLPPALLEIARGLAPFFVFEPETPLARMEIVAEPSLGPTRFKPGQSTLPEP
jgi:protease-4